MDLAANVIKKRRPYVNEYLENLLTRLSEVEEQFFLKPRTCPLLKKEDVFFRDGIRKIDFILVYDLLNDDSSKRKVNQFIANLEGQGLEFEAEVAKLDDNLLYIKVFTPRNRLIRCAIALNIELTFESKTTLPSSTPIVNYNFMYTDLTKPEEGSDIYERATETVARRRPIDFTTAERILLTYQILKAQKFGDGINEFGVRALLKNKHLVTAFPLHDSEYAWSDEDYLSDRQLLAKFWANPLMFYKMQPIDVIYKYYGSEVAFYFAFLGFYNKMLIPAAIFGVICFIYGWLTMHDMRNRFSDFICSSEHLLCPMCGSPEICPFVKLKDFCTESKINYVMDNPVTYTYSIGMCFWATCMYEMWKREQMTLLYKWDLLNLEADPSFRPEYATHTKYRRISQYNGQVEPFVPTTVRCSKMALSFTIIILSACFVCGAVILLIAFRFLMLFNLTAKRSNWIVKHSAFLSTAMANLIMLVVLLTFEYLYLILARFLTDFENPRTQAEYDKSFIYKQYVLGFINAYAHLYYTALFKGKFFTHPGDDNQYNGIGILNNDLCAPQGCLIDLSFQMIVILLGKATFKTLVQFLKPIVITYIRSKKNRHTKDRRQKRKTAPFWEKNFDEMKSDHYFLLTEYKDIVLQYGYIVLFTAAFPLAPLFALLHNLFELRMDAHKFIKLYRRPVPRRVNGITAWINIIRTMTYIGIITNSLIVGFTTHFTSLIIKMYSSKFYNEDVFRYEFSEFAINDFGEYMKEFKHNMEGTSCYYVGKRYGPREAHKYQVTASFWNDLGARFLVVIILESFVICFTGLLAFTIPDVPRGIKERINHRGRLERAMREEKLMNKFQIN